MGFDEAAPEPTRRRHRHRRRRSRARRELLIVAISGLVLILIAGDALWFLAERYLRNVDRIPDPFAALDEGERPGPATSTGSELPLTLLLVGSDPGGAGDPTLTPAADVIMLLRISGSRGLVQFISIPRESWVAIPDHGMNKISVSYSIGGPTLLIRTVEALTSVRIDHFTTVDFSVFQQITDALGGVDVRLAETTTHDGVTFSKGVNHLDGEQALIYLRQREGLAAAPAGGRGAGRGAGGVDQEQRQQSYLAAVLRFVLRQQLLSDLGRTDDLLLALTSAISVDETLSGTDMLGLAFSLRGLARSDLTFLTVPVSGVGEESSVRVAYLDTARAAPLWGYLREDTLADHLSEFDQDLLPEVPR